MCEYRYKCIRSTYINIDLTYICNISSSEHKRAETQSVTFLAVFQVIIPHDCVTAVSGTVKAQRTVVFRTLDALQLSPNSMALGDSRAVHFWILSGILAYISICRLCLVV